MSRMSGVVVGIVKDLDDPQHLGRVQVFFPWLSEENNSQWARVATLMAGPERGSWFMPELDDEVLVAFEHGDMQHPYIIGFLWNGQDKPPINDGINTKVRRLKTVTGHVVDFDDRQGQERIFIKTQGGHEIEMKDSPPASLAIKTTGGQHVKLEDVPASITIQTAGGNFIKITDAPPSIMISSTGFSMSVQAGMMTINCLQASVNASALLNVNAPIAQFSGIVQASTIIGAAYVPAPGNTFGL